MVIMTDSDSVVSSSNLDAPATWFLPSVLLQADVIVLQDAFGAVAGTHQRT